MSIDLRTTQRPPPHISSVALEVFRSQTTRFRWVRVCEHCRCSSTYEMPNGQTYCLGCDRGVVAGRDESSEVTA